jgi:hypothetical protein
MATDVKTQVEQLYVAYFSRPADTAGLSFWSNVLATNPNGYQVISANFAASAEYKSMYANMDNNAVVSAVYQHLFGRPAEASGVSFWADKLNTHVISVDNMVTQIAAGAQGTDAFAYNAKVAVAAAFTDRLDTTAEQQAYSGAAANKIAFNYIDGVKDLQTAAAGMDPGNIDATIATIVGAHTGGMDAPIHIV